MKEVSASDHGVTGKVTNQKKKRRQSPDALIPLYEPLDILLARIAGIPTAFVQSHGL